MKPIEAIPESTRAFKGDGGPPDRVGLVALDLDGTLLAPDGHPTPRARAAVRNLIDAGIPVCVATGRSWWESRRVVSEAGLVGPGVFVGGAIVSDLVSGSTLAHTLMRPAVAQALCRELNDASVAAMVLRDRGYADVEWLIAAEHPMPPTVPEWLAHHGSSYRREAELWSSAHDWTVRVGTVTRTRDDGERLAAHLAARIGEGIYQHLITVASTGVSVLEVFDATVNKWRGVQQVAALLRVDERSVVAVGDDMNDLHMLCDARIGVAMGNARREVRAMADMVIGSNADDGLAVFLERLLADGGQMPSAAARQGV